MSGANTRFDYLEAFSRNIGWVTEAELQRLRVKRVAIAGLGGVGGVHLLTLARLGVGKFSLAEYDRFELPNFNRQVGATVRNLGQPKLDVLVRMASDINPEIEVRAFAEGVNQANLPAFLEDVDVYVDGIDFFAFEARRATYAACRRLGIPATIAVPLGMGVSALTFLPTGMSFEEYFGLEGCDRIEQAVRFLIGVSPAMLQRTYVKDPTRVDLDRGLGPSTPMACQLCAGVAATEALKIMLKRGELVAAPHGFHFDPYRNKYVRTWRPFGHRNPMQRLMLALIRRQLSTMGGRA